jgi:PAS domain S-box-containing protein
VRQSIRKVINVSDESEQPVRSVDEDAAIRSILEGTANQTGALFFAALVKNLANALNVAGAWVTEYLRESKRLRALSFWFEGRYVEDCEYAIQETPCEWVVEEKRLVHIPEKLAQLFPRDHDFKQFGAASYLGVPLLDTDGTILGHLAVIDREPMLMKPRVEALFRIFAARAAAELQRLRAEAEIREREEKLSRLVNSAMDAIIEMDGNLTITYVNRAAGSAFGCDSTEFAGRDFREFLAAQSARKLETLMGELEARPEGQQYLWIPGGLKGVQAEGETFPAEASLARFELRRRGFFTLILRNINDQVKAERRIEFLTHESEYLKEEIEQEHNFREIIGQSRPMLDLLKSVNQVAGTDATVLISGETGTGKELVARAIHAVSRRAQKPLIKVNCAAIPAALMESEFFGHERGAFTGATQRREGRFALADRGTIFLDEVGELPIDLQAKLLRVLQEGEFEPVGSSQTRKVDVRVVAATNRDLQQAVKEGRFREDLYYRLSVFPVAVPPLRERATDTELLARAFAEKCGLKVGRKVFPLSEDCLRRLCAYDWPGNVRELQNVIERAVITSRSGELNLDAALPPSAQARSETPASRGAPESSSIHTARELREIERNNILRALEKTGWRIAGNDGAAKLLGMPPSTLSSRIRALHIKRPR